MPISHTFGSTVKCVVEFYDEAGVATDPTLITFTVRSPTQAAAGTPGTIYTYSTLTDPTPIRRLRTGAYRRDVVGNEDGDWWVEAKGSGAVAAVVQQAFRINKNHVP